MKTAYVKSFAVVLTLICVLWAQPSDVKTKIGILNLDVLGGDKAFNEKVVNLIDSSLKEIGAYDVFTQNMIKESYDKLHIKIPNNCGEPRCASDIGRAVKLDRMIYGSIDKNEKTYGLILTLIDVLNQDIIKTVSLESEPGVKLNDLVKVAVNKLHGIEVKNSNEKTHTYWGPPVHNEKQFALSAGGCIGAGLIWSLASGILIGQDENNGSVVSNYDNMGNEDFFGVPTGADQLPHFGRPSALANAYSAVSGDAYGVFYNPAGMSWVAGPEVAVGYQYRYGLNNFAASFVNKATREIGFGQGIFYSGDIDGLLTEMFFISSVSYKFNELVSWLRPFSIGADIKIKTMKTSGKLSTESQSTGSGIGVALDLGLLMELSDRIKYSVVFKNLPSVYLFSNTASDTSYTEMDSPTLSMGGSFKTGHYTLLVCEGYIPVNKDQRWKFAGGAERILFNVIRGRLGIAKEAYFETPWSFTGGLGLDLKHVVVDLSYEYNTLDVFAHPVNLSFIYRF